MKNVMKEVMILALAVSAVSILSGCANWEKKYKALNVEHENLKGRYENCVSSLESSGAEMNSINKQLSENRLTIEELEKQLEERSAAEATGFTGMDVEYDRDAATITVTLPGAILFRPGSASLRKSTNADLDHVLSVLRKRYSGHSFDVVGHTDSDPVRKSKKFWKDNWELSAERALTVLRYLTGHGVRAEDVRAVACGASRTVAANSTASGKAKNRRVEIVVHMM